MNFLDDFISGVSGGGGYPPAVVESTVTRLKFSTSAGDFTVEVDRALSPSGVDRLLDLVSAGFFDNQILYRVIPGSNPNHTPYPNPNPNPNPDRRAASSWSHSVLHSPRPREQTRCAPG